MIDPWYTAVEPFDHTFGEKWTKYIDWSGLTQLKELVSFDGCLCPNIIKELKAEDWKCNIQEDFVIFFFTDLDYLLKRVDKMKRVNILAAVRNPQSECGNAFSDPMFEFKGYDVVDVCADISALTNCGGFPKAFQNEELSDVGLVPSLERAVEINCSLQEHYPGESHADCDVWELWKMKTGPEQNL